MRRSPCIKPDRASGASTRPTREGRCFYLTTAFPSILGYHRDLDESFIRLSKIRSTWVNAKSRNSE